MFAFLDSLKNNHIMSAYLANKVDSIFHRYTPPPLSVVGSNNAGAPIMPQGSSGAMSGPAPIGGNNVASSYMTQPAPVPRASGSGGPSFTGGNTGYTFGGNYSMPSSYGSGRYDQGFGGFVTEFKAGGLVTPTGGAIRPGAGMQEAPRDEPLMGADEPMPMDGGQIEQEATKFVQSNPQQAQQVRAVIMHAIQTGQLTYDELNLAVQLAKAALANPASYPQLRAFAIKNGLGSAQDLPPTMDRGMLFTLILVGKTLQSAGAPTQGGSAPTQGNMVAPQGQPKGGLLPEYDNGGMTSSKKHIAVVHPEEYIIPKDVVLYHGKKHLDKLVEQARTPPDGQ